MATDDRSAPTLTNGSTKPEDGEQKKSLAFLFVPEKGYGTHSSSNRSAVRSHVVRQSKCIRQRRDAPANRHRRILEKSPVPELSKASSNGSDVAPISSQLEGSGSHLLDPFAAHQLVASRSQLPVITSL